MSKGLHINQVALEETTDPTSAGHLTFTGGDLKVHDGSGVVNITGDIQANQDAISAQSQNEKWLPLAATCTFGLGNITLSGEQNLNGVLTSSDIVVVNEQTDPADNGVYLSDALGWSRIAQFDEAGEINNGTNIRVINALSACHRDVFIMTSPDVATVGTDPITWERIPSPEFGTTAGTVAEGNDSRFHDAATLNAGTVTQDGADLTGQELTLNLATASNHGLLDKTDKSKLDNIDSGAEVNVNADWNAVSGDAEILNKPTDLTDLSTHNVTELSDVTDAGSGAIITTAERNALHDAVTLNAGAITQESANLSGQEIELVASTTTTAGVMSAADKLKLDNIAAGANNYTHPNHTGEVTSVADGAQTLDPTAITNKTAVSADGADYVLISDDSDAGNLKKVLASEFLGGGGTLHDRQAAKLGGSVSTAVDTYALVGGMTLTTGDLTENGDYIINFRCQWDYSNKGQSACWFILYLNGSPVALTEQVMSVGRDQEGQGVPFSATYSLFNVAAGSTIEIWFKESSSGLFSVYGRELSIDGIGITNTL